MAFTPQTVVYLLDTPLCNDYKNQLYFANTTGQYNYFSSRIKHTLTDITYQRKDNVILADIHIDDLWNVNYVMYQNKNFGNKWFYAFITDMKFKSNNCTEIYIETDVYQTWLTECDLLPSFVVREHVMDDTIGKHINDEGIEYGEYIHKSYKKTNLFSDLAFVVAISDMSPLLPEGVTANPRMYDNMYSGLIYWAFSSNNISGLNEFIKLFEGKQDAIAFIFTIPITFLPDQTDGQIMSGESGSPVYYEHDLQYDNIDGYVPKNKKLFCYPYNFLAISNNQGNVAEYHFENFYFGSGGKPTFKIRSHIAPNPSVVCTPLNYKYNALGEVPEYAITLNGYPFCSWNTDVYKNWLAQNTANVVLNTVGGASAMIGGIATGNLLAVGGGVMAIANQLAQVNKANIQPDQARGNTNNGSFNIAHKRQDFYFSHMTIKREYAERIDQYFSMYGYKINKVKVPNVSGRLYWNYVQTIDVNIKGAIPDKDMLRLKKMYNDGVTFWKSADSFGDYSKTNAT